MPQGAPPQHENAADMGSSAVCWSWKTVGGEVG
jgi:hypothetical protein